MTDRQRPYVDPDHRARRAAEQQAQEQAAAVTLAQAAAANRAALVAKLYDEWGGRYILQRIDGGAYVTVRELSRDEALEYRVQDDEAFRLEWKR